MNLWRNKQFRKLCAIYFATYSAEGFLIIYLFNAIKAAGLTSMNSAVVFIASYLPSLLLWRLLAKVMRRHGGKSVLIAATALRSAVCVVLAVIPIPGSLAFAIGYVVVIETLWYFMMPAIDDIEGTVLAREHLSSGESILTVVLQVSLFLSLFLGGVLADGVGASALLAGGGLLQLVIIGVSLRLTGAADEAKRIPADDSAPRDGSLPVVLFLALALVLAVPQMINILLPLKVFSSFGNSTSLGLIDSMYNLGAFVAATGSTSLLAKAAAPTRRGLVAWLLIQAAVVITLFAFAERLVLSVLLYSVFGMTVATARILLRVAVFERVSTEQSGAYFAALTRYSLIISLVCSLLIGLVGQQLDYRAAYLILPGMCVLSFVLFLVAGFRHTREQGEREKLGLRREVARGE